MLSVFAPPPGINETRIELIRGLNSRLPVGWKIITTPLLQGSFGLIRLSQKKKGKTRISPSWGHLLRHSLRPLGSLPSRLWIMFYSFN